MEDSVLDDVLYLLGVEYSTVRVGNQRAVRNCCDYILAVETAEHLLGQLKTTFILYGFDRLDEIERYLLLESEGALDYHVICMVGKPSKQTILPYYIENGGKFYIPWVAFFHICEEYDGDFYEVKKGKDPDKIYGVDFR